MKHIYWPNIERCGMIYYWLYSSGFNSLNIYQLHEFNYLTGNKCFYKYSIFIVFLQLNVT